MGKNVAGLAFEDWNFEGVPSPELVACCIWEYARESPSICKAAGMARRAALPLNVSIGVLPKLVALNEGVTEETATESMRPLQYSGLFWPVIMRLPFPDPWLTLNRKQRERCMLNFRTWFTKPYSPIERWDDSNVLQQLQELVRENSNQMGKFMAKRMRGIPASWDEVKTVLPSIITDNGFEHFLIRIDWRDFTNDAIADYFREWLKKNRPANVPNPKKTGHRKYSHVALRDLGVMRLMNFSTVAGMKAHCPLAADHFNKPGWESKHWSAARKRALRNFRAFFPFLPEDELPLHAPTKGGRAKL